MREEATEPHGTPEDLATKREGQGERAQRTVERLPRGTLVGRYVVLDVLGEGGMGVVYAAFDPELDRKVAIKLLQATAGGSSGGVQAWIMREAQALARLSHPNVVAVHDVGSLPGDRVFVAMELVEGQSLRTWLEPARRWQDVLHVMRAAGAGLAAAHAAGLVHRDFKPDNVVVGADGRVRVMDFGLARLQGDTAEPASQDADRDLDKRSPLAANLTHAGSLVGTPAYMAPELYAGHAADALSDQFAFGVALYEAVYRKRPYEREELRHAGPPPKPKAPPEIGVPGTVERVVMRAISIDRAARFGSMDDLLAELAVDPQAKLRRLVLVGGGVAAAAVIAFGAFAMSRARVEQCTGIEHRLVGAWDPAVEQSVQRAFAATSVAYAANAFTGLSRALDAYATEWTAAAVDSCRATRVRGEQTEEELSLREDCLGERLEELRAFSQQLVKADDQLVPRAERGAQSLDPVRRCSDLAALRAPGVPPPEINAKLGPVHEQLANAKAEIAAGRSDLAVKSATTALAAARAIGYTATIAEVQMVLGLAMFSSGNSPDATKMLTEATWSGMRGKRDDIVARSALYVARATADGLGKPDEAAIWLALGSAAVARIGVDRTLELERLESEGVIAAQRGDLASAARALEQGLGVAKALYGDATVRSAAGEYLLAGTLTKMGAYAKALPYYDHAIATIETNEGKDHPDLAPMLSGLGLCYAYTGDLAKARAALARSLAMREHAFGADSPMLVPALNNMADVLVKHGDAVDALPLLERATTIADKTIGRSHPLYHTVETTRAEALAALHRVADARAAYDTLLGLEDKAHSPEIVTTLTSRATFELDEHASADAASFAQRAIAAAEARGGTDSPELWEPLAVLGRAQVALGKPADARTAFERAIAIAEKLQITAGELAPVRAALAALPR